MKDLGASEEGVRFLSLLVVEYPVLNSSCLMVAAMEFKHLSANHWKLSSESCRCLVKSLVAILFLVWDNSVEFVMLQMTCQVPLE